MLPGGGIPAPWPNLVMEAAEGTGIRTFSGLTSAYTAVTFSVDTEECWDAGGSTRSTSLAEVTEPFETVTAPLQRFVHPLAVEL